MTESTINDVANMAHELTELRATNDSLRRTTALQAQELDALRVEAVMLRAASLRANDRASAMYAIMENVSEGLILGIGRMRRMDADTARRQQEAALVTPGAEPPPEFIGRLNPEAQDAAGVRTGRLPPAPAAEAPQPAPQPRQSAPYVPTDAPAPQRPAPYVPPDRDRTRELASRPVVRAEPAQRGIRTDIVDDRLPKVTPGDNADADGLLAMHVLLGERGPVR